MKEYYKAVWIDEGGKAVSYMTPAKDMVVHYTLGREVVAPVGGLLAFDDLEKAKKFCRQVAGTGLLKCIGEEPMPLPVLRFTRLLPEVAQDLSPSQYDAVVRQVCEDLWSGTYHREIARYGPWIQGTVAVRRLVPEEWLDID